MKNILFLFLLTPLIALSQWSVTAGINGGRNDDIHFLNDSVAYVAGGNQKKIYKSTDGGNSWNSIYNGSKYLRSIKFIDESLGFAGTLDSTLVMTTDSGSTWTDVAASISPRPSGVCGLSVPNDSTIYGVGIFNQPAFLIKSTNRGKTWTSTDMSSLVSALVEVHFISQDTGWASGRANPQSDGGEILYTTDGGSTWTSVFKTQRNLDYVWKIQSPDGQNYFASVSSTPAANGTYFLKSNDRGLTWIEGLVDSNYTDIQVIGFTDSFHGFTGGANDLFETFDGGTNWMNVNSTIPNGRYYNRFVRVNDSISFLTGLRVYKYKDTNIVTNTFVHHNIKDELHQLLVYPNPTEKLVFKAEIGNRTHVVIQLINNKGEIIEEFLNGTLLKGSHIFSSTKTFKAQTAFLIMRTNEGLIYEKVILL